MFNWLFNGWLIPALVGSICASLVAIFTKLGITNVSASLAGTIKAIITALFFILFSIKILKNYQAFSHTRKI